MIKISFLNVGQGDSIVFQWTANNKAKIGILDCNLLPNNVNRTIEYLIENNIDEIEYLILSHPHSDHYSGFLSLLEYCYNKKISIKYFLHTCGQVPEYLKSAVTSNEEGKKLAKLFQYLKSNRKALNMEVAVLQSELPFSLPLNQDFAIDILSPSEIEREDYTRQALPLLVGESRTNNPNANYLSTILKLKSLSNNWFVLFTSDAEKRTFKRLKNNQAINEEEQLLVGQIPHHGAKRNHYAPFWKKIHKIDSSILIVSVGENQYGHPSNDVISFFKKEGFSIYSTLNTGKYFNNSSSNISSSEIALNMFSLPTNPYLNMKENDKVFNIDFEGNISVFS